MYFFQTVSGNFGNALNYCHQTERCSSIGEAKISCTVLLWKWLRTTERPLLMSPPLSHSSQTGLLSDRQCHHQTWEYDKDNCKAPRVVQKAALTLCLLTRMLKICQRCIRTVKWNWTAGPTVHFSAFPWISKQEYSQSTPQHLAVRKVGRKPWDCSTPWE